MPLAAQHQILFNYKIHVKKNTRLIFYEICRMLAPPNLPTKAMRKFLFIFLFISLASVAGFSQGTLKGRIVDSASKQPLGLATVSVFKAADTVLVSYRLSTPEGDFKVPAIPFDINCRVVVTYSGYSIYRKEFTITASQQVLDLGTITLMPDAKSLDEVLVIAERPPVVVKKDTIEFNANAFKTLPNALVEDLLKKLPGVQVDKDGNILVNGKPVNRILVDGKTFFGDDPKMATRNLPANVIDKVQVTDDKEELLRNGDDNINNVGKVINITLKKGVKKGWFGKLYGGLGTEDLYEAGGIANIYRDTLQLSVLGYMNNMNKAGFSFSELMQSGGFDRSRSNSSSSSTSVWNNGAGGSSISINGVNFGGMQNYGGVSTSKGAGFNLNHAPSTKKSFFAQYFYGNVVVDRRTQTTTEQFNDDTVITNGTLLRGGVVTQAHNIGVGARLKPDSVTNLLINASYTIGHTDENRLSDVSSINNLIGQLSSGNIGQKNIGNTYYYRQSINFTHLSKTKKGRRYTLSHNLDINNRFNDNTTASEMVFYYPSHYDSLSSQLRSERIPRTDANFMFNYSDPLSKRLTFRTSGRYEFGKLNNDISTFNKSAPLNPGFDVPNDSLTSNFERISNRVMASAGVEFKWKDLAITPSLRGLLQYVDNDLESMPSSVKQEQANLLPVLSIVYKQLNFNYSRDIQLPFYTALLPVADNSNPYYIQKGNIDLLPMKRDNFSVNYYFNNAKRYFNAAVYANGAVTQNDIVQSITVDEKGIQTSMPVNADGSRNFYVNFNVYKQYKNNQKFIFSWNAGGNYNFNRSRLFYNSVSSWQSTFNFNNWVGVNLNWNDRIELNTSYSFGRNFTRYTTTELQPLKINYQWWDNELVIRWPKHVIWETQCSYSYNSNVPANTPKEIVRWNAAVNFTMLKNEAGVLKLSVFDILDQNRNLWSSANRNMIATTQTNALPQYFMGTFTYNVRPAGVKKKVGGRERLFLF